jgi:polysaccharide chain length determinant protein (PEP-CTERM system associated)
VKEVVLQGYEWARAAWRRRRLALLTAWCVALAIWAVVLILPDRYEASARVFVDARTALRPVLQGIAIEEDYESQLSLVREALLSRPQLETVARKTKLDVDVTTPTEMDALISALQKQIKVGSVTTDERRGQAGDTIYTISYQHTNRDKSVEVVQTLLNNFEEGTQSGNRNGTDQAQIFLGKQIGELEKRLQDSEERLAEFKKRNVGMIPGERGDYFARMDKEMTGLQEAETKLAVAMSRRSELQHQLETSRAYLPGSAALSNPVAMAGAPPDVTLRRQEAEQKLEDLLLRYTEKHPEVIALRRTIAELKAKETTELADLQSGGMGTGAIRSLSANPVYQQIQSQLNQSHVEIASLQGEVSQHRSEIANLRKFVDQAPEIEQEFSRLNRDYTVTKEQYNQLVTRREQARVSDDAARTGIVRFDTIEPPRAANTPVAPKRALLIVAGLFAAIGAGLALALLPHFLRPTFGDTETLERRIGLPVIGSVSAFRTDLEREQDRSSTRRAVFAGIALVALAGVLATVGPLGMQLLRNLIT